MSSPTYKGRSGSLNKKYLYFFLFAGQLWPAWIQKTQSGSEDQIESGSNPDLNTAPITKAENPCFWVLLLPNRGGSGKKICWYPHSAGGGMTILLAF